MNRWATARAGWTTQAARTRGGRLGQAEDSAQNRIQIRKPFSFSKLFYKLQINLNSNQI
jgi:hypothetical protein